MTSRQVGAMSPENTLSGMPAVTTTAYCGSSAGATPAYEITTSLSEYPPSTATSAVPLLTAVR